MSYTKEELLFRQVLEEMGIPVQEGQGGITIEGIPAAKYLDKHDIFEVPEEFIQVGVSVEEKHQEELFSDGNSDLLNAA